MKDIELIRIVTGLRCLGVSVMDTRIRVGLDAAFSSGLHVDVDGSHLSEGHENTELGGIQAWYCHWDT